MIKFSKGLDPWERQYLEGWTPRYPLTDEAGYNFYPVYRWVYSKSKLYSAVGELNAQYLPKGSVIKPDTNLNGMGRGVFKLDEPYVAVPKYKGTHTSTDYVIKNGRIEAHFSFIAHKDQKDSFTCFESTKLRSIEQLRFIGQFMRHYTGYLNIEQIGNNILEVHLRPSMQFFDICGGLIASRKAEFEKTFSVVYRAPHNFVIQDDTLDYTGQSYIQHTTTRSIQVCFESGKPVSSYDQDTRSYRYFVVNGTSHRDALLEIKNLRKVFATP